MANDRNAGRKPILNYKTVRLKIPVQHVATLKKFAKTLQFENQPQLAE
jgi:hypothetical protein